MLDRTLALAPWRIGIGLAVIAHLSATSRLRRRALTEACSLSFAAINRDDPWFVPVVHEPDCEIYMGAGLRTLGLADYYRGHAGWWEGYDAGREIFADLRLTPEHLVDLGDRWVLQLGVSGTGRLSDVPTHQVWGCLYHMSSRGRIARQDYFDTWEETLIAAGLDRGR